MEALILSTVRYCLEIWGQRDGVQHTVQVAMNGAMRTFLNVKDTQTPVEDLLRWADWLSVPNMWRNQVIFTMHRVMDTKIPETVWWFFETAHTHQHNTRGGNAGFKLAWNPKTEAGTEAVVNQGRQIMTEARLTHGSKHGMEKAEYKAMVKATLISVFGNKNA